MSDDFNALLKEVDELREQNRKLNNWISELLEQNKKLEEKLNKAEKHEKESVKELSEIIAITMKTQQKYLEKINKKST